jgi:hypothetical protein
MWLLSRSTGLLVRLARDDPDLVICGLAYVWLADRRPPSVEPLAATVLAGDRYDDIGAMQATIEAAGWTSLRQAAIDR